MFNKNVFFKRLFLGGMSVVMSAVSIVNAQVSSFEDLATVLGTSKYWDGTGVSDGGSFTSGGATFSSLYETSYGGYWTSGWAYSNIINTTSAGFNNLYAAVAGEGANNSATYAIGQQDAIVKFSGTVTVTGLQATNSTYAALSMKNGDSFAKKFGGTTGDDPDYFKFTVWGYQNGTLNTTTGIDFYLADFRSSISGEDFILDAWKTLDLTALGGVDSILFQLSSSDTGVYGINTPLFFCIDNLSVSGENVADFENMDLSANSYWNKLNTDLNTGFSDGLAYFHTVYSVTDYGDYWSKGFAYSTVNNTTLAGYSNQYAAIPGAGYDNSQVYAVAYGTSKVKLSSATTVTGFYVTNTTYAYISMKNGDNFAKKFGGTSGNDADYFKLVVKGFLNGTPKTDTVAFYLADFRDSDNSKDYILDTWQWVDLQKFGKVDSLVFYLLSSDVGIYGMNTPAYFALDDLTAVEPLITGIADKRSDSSASIYPNPATDVLNITLPHDISGNVAVTIININGAEVATNIQTTGTMAVNIAELPQGIYFVKIGNSKYNYFSKFVKQ